MRSKGVDGWCDCDGVHDEFRGMGLSGVQEFMDEGAAAVDGGGCVSQLQCDNEYYLRK